MVGTWAPKELPIALSAVPKIPKPNEDSDPFEERGYWFLAQSFDNSAFDPDVIEGGGDDPIGVILGPNGQPLTFVFEDKPAFGFARYWEYRD